VFLLAILTGVIGFAAHRRHIHWFWVLAFCGWGILAAAAPIGHYPSLWLQELAARTSQVF
jgi:hypothetical protein